MAKVSIVCGSGNKSGYTRAICDDVVSFYEKDGCNTELFVISEMEIGHCTGCGSCRSGRCVIRDDMERIYSAFEDSDMLVLVTPIHFSGPSSLIKTMIDRFQPYWYCKTMKHPSKCILLMCGGSPEPDFGPTEKIVRAFSITTGMEYSGSLRIPYTDSRPDGIEDEVNDFLQSIRS